ncbi:MAG: conjugal transfer protein TraL [Proteobacteria bacterium]|nr:conjugal transfer protein TraL [Pseudomonadota bacterium]
MSQIHFILQGKGGVGKTLVSAIFAQHHRSGGKKIHCLDTDPVNASFAGFKSLEVRPVHILQGSTIDPRQFDELMEILLNAEDDVVVDTGASTFLPLTSYLEETDAISVLMDAGKKVLLHVVVTGGQSKDDTLTGLNGIADRIGNKAPIMLWVNEYFGRFAAADGISLEKTGVYTAHKKKILSIVTIPERPAATFGKDISEMLTKKLTFDEAIASKDFNTMAKQRIKITRDLLFKQLDEFPL